MKGFISLCLCALTLLGSTACDVSHMSTLPEISRPYVGEYVCEQLQWGGYDMLPEEQLLFKLNYDGTFSLYFKGKNRAELTGEYEVSSTGGSIALTVDGQTRKFPVANGNFTLHFPINGKLLVAKFCLK